MCLIALRRRRSPLLQIIEIVYPGHGRFRAFQVKFTSNRATKRVISRINKYLIGGLDGRNAANLRAGGDAPGAAAAATPNTDIRASINMLNRYLLTAAGHSWISYYGGLLTRCYAAGFT